MKNGVEMTLEDVMNLLSEINGDYDYSVETGLISEGKLDSFDVVGLVAELSARFGVKISALDITAENFDSAEAIFKLVS